MVSISAPQPTAGVWERSGSRPSRTASSASPNDAAGWSGVIVVGVGRAVVAQGAARGWSTKHMRRRLDSTMRAPPPGSRRGDKGAATLPPSRFARPSPRRSRPDSAWALFGVDRQEANAAIGVVAIDVEHALVASERVGTVGPGEASCLALSSARESIRAVGSQPEAGSTLADRDRDPGSPRSAGCPARRRLPLYAIRVRKPAKPCRRGDDRCAAIHRLPPRRRLHLLALDAGSSGSRRI